MINELVHQTSDVVRARSAFLSGDEHPSAVRPEIFAFWRRSALLGAQPDIATLLFRAGIDSKDALHVAARPVLDRLDRTTTALLLADRDACPSAHREGEETLCGEGDRAFRVTAVPVLDGNQVVGALVRLSGAGPWRARPESQRPRIAG
jgi:hypothetical protein